MRPLMTAAILAMISISWLTGATAQQNEAGGKPLSSAKVKKVVAAKPKSAPGMKTCNYKFPDGERRVWSCRKEEPCCAWDAIKYVKCGSTVTNCL